MSETELREQFNRQAGRIQRLEEDLKAVNALVKIVERDMPAMLAYVDADERYRFHNQAYRRWLGLDAEQINGRTLRDVLGEPVYSEIAEHLARARSGVRVRYERTHAAGNGDAMHLCVHLVPRFDSQRTVAGLYLLIVDHSEGAAPARLIAPIDPADTAEDAPELYDGTVAKAQAEWKAAAERIRAAIKNNEFRLYCQTIQDLAADAPPFYGIFVRQAEEERNMMPPGAFFALAEEYGITPELDRWAVDRVLAWASERRQGSADWRPSMYCINLSRDTISDPYFPDFVHERVSQSKLSAETLCFELQESDAVGLPADTAELVRNLRSIGSRIMLGGFGRDKVSIEILKELHVDFLKIDGSIVMNFERNEATLARLRGIVRLAHTIGINTVAELVETEETLAKLRALGVDYAQGVAISAALPLNALN